MSSKSSSAADLMNWNRQILGFLGVWPQKPKNSRFFLFLGYLFIHVTLEYTYLYQNINKLDYVVASMTENIPFTVTLWKLVLFHNKKNTLCDIIHKVKRNSEVQHYRSEQELRIFLRYNAMAKYFIRIVVSLVSSSAIVYFAKPLVNQFQLRGGTDSLILDLPYRVYLFYDVSDVRSYALTYALQSPLVMIATFGYTGTDCLLATLTFHICGELSILGMRIRNLNCNSEGCNERIRLLIDRHVQLIRMAKSLEDAFNPLLLGQLLGGTFLICLLGFNVLENTSEGRETDLLNFSLYGFAVVVLLYVYCYIGDCLTKESTRVRDAFFHCSWYELPAKDSKSLVTCIIQSQKPLHLTAGKFYVFSLESFADVIKTSMAYLSVLRTLL